MSPHSLSKLQLRPLRRRLPVAKGFTLVEIMVSLAVLTILLLVSAQVIGQVQRTWSSANARTTQFKESRTAFDIIIRNLSQATLDTFVDYDYSYLAEGGNNNATSPRDYQPRSYLHFVCGLANSLVPNAGPGQAVPGHAIFFQAPLGVSSDPNLAGLDRLLCARGYFIKFSSDEAWVPQFVRTSGYKPRFRYRLMEYCPPAEFNAIYDETTAANAGNRSVNRWYSSAGNEPRVGNNSSLITLTRPVADNVVTLIISPRRELRNGETEVNAARDPLLAPNYAFDSRTNTTYRHQLPPVVRIVLIAIDEASAIRLEQLRGSTTTPPLRTTPTFTSADQMAADVAKITTDLLAERLNYRVFSATVPLRASKFSELVTNSSP
jgi:uncharacterized protein (TIGR02599 family)